MCRLIETPIIKDMRETAKALGVTDHLIGILKCPCSGMCIVCLDRLKAALSTLGIDQPSPFDRPAPDPRD